MWDTLESKLMSLVTEYVPKRKLSKKMSGKKPLWMNDKAYTKVRKKYYSHKRYRTTPEGENYSAYARDRNQANWEVKRAVREYEKKLALEVKQNPKAFYKYASSRLVPPSRTWWCLMAQERTRTGTKPKSSMPHLCSPRKIWHQYQSQKPKRWKVSWNRFRSQRRTSWRGSTSWRPIRVQALTVCTRDYSRS